MIVSSWDSISGHTLFSWIELQYGAKFLWRSKLQDMLPFYPPKASKLIFSFLTQEAYQDFQYFASYNDGSDRTVMIFFTGWESSTISEVLMLRFCVKPQIARYLRNRFSYSF